MANAHFALGLLLALLFSTSTSWAQTRARPQVTTPRPPVMERKFDTVHQWSLGLGYWSWTETLQMSSGSLSDTDYANLKADVFSLGYRSLTGPWGYQGDLLYFIGKASAGGNASLIKYKSQRNWNGYGFQAGAFYRWIRQVEMGLHVPVIFRDSTWPSDPGSKVEGVASPLVTGMVFWRISPWPSFFIENGIGPMGWLGQTIWKLDVQLNF